MVLTVEFTVWRRCCQCGTWNNKARQSCRDCGLGFVSERLTDDIAPLDGVWEE